MDFPGIWLFTTLGPWQICLEYRWWDWGSLILRSCCCIGCWDARCSWLFSFVVQYCPSWNEGNIIACCWYGAYRINIAEIKQCLARVIFAPSLYFGMGRRFPNSEMWMLLHGPMMSLASQNDLARMCSSFKNGSFLGFAWIQIPSVVLLGSEVAKHRKGTRFHISSSGDDLTHGGYSDDE